MQTTKVFKTAQDTILIVTANTAGCNGRNYVSVTANEIEPILRTDAVSRCRESLEDGELWRMAVQSENTELGLNEWVEYVLGSDGELSGFDNSLYNREIEIDGEDYIFDSRACGCMHDDIKEVSGDFDILIALHLSDSSEALKQAEKIILSLQNTEDADIDFWVEKYTREILGIDA